MFSAAQVKRASIIAITVGSILNITNQYEAIFLDQSLNLPKLFITYAIPFGVSLMSVFLEQRQSLSQNKIDKNN
jgi:hypothetical protein